VKEGERERGQDKEWEGGGEGSGGYVGMKAYIYSSLFEQTFQIFIRQQPQKPHYLIHLQRSRAT